MEYKVNLLKLNQPNWHQDAERFAFFYSKEYEGLFENKMIDTDDANMLQGYLEISANGKSVYRKYHGLNIPSETVQLTYRTMCELKVKNNDVVDVKSSNWFKYLFNNSDPGVKWPFRIGLYSLIFAIASITITLIQSFLCCY